MPTKADIEAIAKSRRRRVPAFLVWGAVAILAAAGLWYWLGSGAGAPSLRYVTDEARLADIVVTVTATGTVEPTNQVDISSELSGRIRTVDVDYNDPVKIGQILANLDTDKLEANLEHARAMLTARQASLAEAEATLDEKRDAYERAVHLEERGISSRETLLATKAAHERAKAALDSAKANVRVAEADLKLEQTNLDKACICSPIDGIVLSRSVEPGQIVASTLQAPTLFTLAEDLTKMKLTVDIDEADIGKVSSGNHASFTVEAFQDREFEAVIVQLRYAPQTVEGVVTYEAILDVDNSGLLLRPGMTATAEITVAEIAQALTVPNAALRFTPPVTETGGSGGSGLLGMLLPRPPRSGSITQNVASNDGRRSIWVLRGNEAAEVTVRTGSTDGSVTEILEGEIAAGDKVVIDTESGR